MILRMNQPEVASTVLHMAIMRKSVRNGFKRNYKERSKEMVASFDEVKDTMEKALVDLNENSCHEMDLHFNVKEVDMLESFLAFYLPKMESYKESFMEQDYEQLEHLQSIAEKLKELRVQYA